MRVMAIGASCLFLACGSSGGSGPGNSSGSSSGGGGSCPNVTIDQQCVGCVQSNCGMPVTAALGPNWASKEFAGTCSDMMACICACSDAACGSQCESSASVDCQMAKAAVNQCTTQACQTNCVLF